ncbi:CoA pyrophosphatase [Janibacter sp. CX7]|uniref:NUDIX hydrolase n=1 Tax=Janibacter sp. CX7 TaxID=2963431 RepID=UPI0020CB9B46|nr:CoA pyrophosphatase [Janibacter sp. CX7]UTT65648.1 CoA pyrophosphatase [Janibacter sp. CX7]
MTADPTPAPPTWLLEAEAALRADLPSWFTDFAPPPDPQRRSAVLMLVSPGESGHDIVLTERSGHLRSHAGQVSFPGGKLDPGETPVDAALRETWEEVGADPAGIEIIGSFPDLWLSPSANAVTPVLGWSPEPGPLRVVDPGEVARVERIPVADLVDPANRFMVKGPSGYVGPAFEVAGLFVWGFTAQLVSVLLDAADLTEPWDEGRRRRLPWRYVKPYLTQGVRRSTTR